MKQSLGALNIAELRASARKVLPKGLFEFVDRGTEDEGALLRNRQALDGITALPRVLVDVSKRSLATTFFGRPAAMPLAVAPTGAAGLLWFDGEIEIALAAEKAGIPFTLSTASIVSMERVAEASKGRLWFQLYMWPDRAMSYRLVDRVRSAGYEALMVTVDAPVSSNREYNLRNGFSLPLRLTRTNIFDVLRHPRWLGNVFLRYLLRSGMPMLENYPDELRTSLTASPTPQRLPKNDSVNWDDLRELRRRWKGPLLIKGVLHPDDAKCAVDCGVDGVVVSNHGGRTLDISTPPILALPEIVERVGGRAEVYVDSGFQRGSDVVKALALGARGVLVGRAPLWGVAVGGEHGASAALRILREETDRVAAMLGVPDLSRIDPTLSRGFLSPSHARGSRQPSTRDVHSLEKLYAD